MRNGFGISLKLTTVDFQINCEELFLRLYEHACVVRREMTVNVDLAAVVCIIFTVMLWHYVDVDRKHCQRQSYCHIYLLLAS